MFAPLLQVADVPGLLLRALAVLTIAGVVVLVGRVVLQIAWRLVAVAAVVLGLVLAAMLLLPAVVGF